MNNDWKQFLSDAGASQSDRGYWKFTDDSNTEAIEGNMICDLSHFSTLVIAGPDAVEFMQGQFTNDVALIDDGLSQLSAFCNNKGRMIANFRLFTYQGNYFMSVRQGLVEHSIDHLQHFVLSAQVALQDVSEQLVHIGVSGDDIETLLRDFIDDLNSDIDSVSANDDYIAIRVAGDKPRYEIFCAEDKARLLWQALSPKVTVANGDRWDLLNIRSGLPFIESVNSAAFVPQMVNMELINGVSFSKGCYTGQEIVARTHYLGKQKRRSFRLRIESEKPPSPGDQLATDTSTVTQYVGTVIDAYPVSDNVYEALAVIQIASTSEPLKLKDIDSSIELLELPYALEAKA